MRLPITRAVRNKDKDFWHPICASATASAVSRRKHYVTGCSQCRCYICLSAVDVNVVDSVQHRPTIPVSVEMKNDFNTTAELHQADLCQVRANGKCSNDTFDESEH